MPHEINNAGYETEERMRKWFRGQKSHLDFVDFETKNVLWEVKSCNLFNRYYNSNHCRKSKGKIPHHDVNSFHLGRFFINLDNHFVLKSKADAIGKVAKYIFVVKCGRQMLWRVLNWELVPQKSTVRIKDVFGVSK